MKRSAPHRQFLSAALSADIASMSSRSPYRGGGRKQWGRTFSNRPNRDQQQQFVTGDSHFQSVRDANFGILHGEVSRNFNPPPCYNHNQQFRQPPAPPFDQNQYQNRQLRQSPQFNQNYRPRRPAKPADYRNWEYAKTAPSPDCDKFIVLSYNILADYLAINHRSKLYYHIPRYMLDWQHRKRSIIFELGLWSADIMCFQEVDRFQELEAELKVRGYNGIWKMRTGDAIDGCAVFWRTLRFKLLYEESIEFNKVGLRDNVAQICVLELVRQHDAAEMSASPTSSTSFNKVVICNIHVLYNPKRGEIKLGQVRMLLDRAHAVSKLWNDAPVVLCGDFNCTPKSPLYNFISEQKLDLSGIDKDKVSGQASAEIRIPRPYNSVHNPNANPGSESDNSIQVPLMVDSKPGDSFSDMHKHNNVNESVKNVPFISDYSQLQHTRAMLDASDGIVDSAVCVEETKEIRQNVLEQSSTCHSDCKLPINQMNDGMQKSTTPLASHSENAYCDEHEREQREGNSGSLFNQVLSCERSEAHIYAETTNCDKLEMSASRSSGCLSSQSIGNEGNPDLSVPYQTNISDASTSVCYVGDKQLEDVSPQEPNDFFPEEGSFEEDQSTFLSALHGMKDLSVNDFNCSSGELVSDSNDPQLHLPSDEVQDGFYPGLDSESVYVEKTAYDPSLWTPMELVTATGNTDCTYLEHPLKLKSTYADVEDCSGTRDPNGEPLVTSYNRCFMGTVDYIWCSEGLQTVKVLAPMAKHAMQWTAGFPTKKWGSDHIALASELAFSKHINDNNIEAQ